MAGFAEGFANGFGLVDAAMQRRQQNALAQQNAVQEAAYRKSVLDRQSQLDQREQAWHNEEQAAIERKEAFEREKFKHEIGKDNKVLGLREAEQAGEAAYRNSAAEVARANAETNRMATNSSIAENQAQIEYKRLEMRNMQAQTDKENALMRLKPYLKSDPSTGATTISVPNENISAFVNDAKVGLGVDFGRVSGDLNRFTDNVNVLKSAIVQPQKFQSNKKRVLDALNDLDAIDIGKDYGDSAAGQKRITDALYHPPEAGYPEGFYTFEATVSGIDANGNQVSSAGPVTEFRSSSPSDQNVRRITPSQLIRRIDGYDALGNILKSNPQFTDQISNALAVERKPTKREFLRFDQGDDFGQKTTVYVDKDTHNVIDANGNVMTPAELNAMRNPPAMRTETQTQAQPATRTKINAAELAKMTPQQRRAFFQERQKQQAQ